MTKKAIIVFLISFSYLTSNGYACTTWATLGDINQQNGLLLTKNRDAPPNEVQQLQFIKPSHGYRYFALKYKHHPNESTYRYTSAGINEKGLTVVNNASDAPTNNQDENETIVMDNILQNYDSVAAVVKDQQKLFTKSQVNFLLIGDRNEVALIEIAPDGKYAIRTMINGIFWHTNFYTDIDLSQYNSAVQRDSIVRYHRIDYLLHHHPEKFSLTDNEKFSVDHVAGDNNSILRKWTVASWFVTIPKNGVPSLYVKLFNPLQQKQNVSYRLDQEFWQR